MIEILFVLWSKLSKIGESQVVIIVIAADMKCCNIDPLATVHLFCTQIGKVIQF